MKKDFQNGEIAPSEDNAAQIAAIGQLLAQAGFKIASVSTNYNVEGGTPSEFQAFTYINPEYSIGIEVTSTGKVGIAAAQQSRLETLMVERGTMLLVPNTLFFQKPELILEFIQSLVPGKKAIPNKSKSLN